MLIKKCKHLIEVANRQSQVLFSQEKKSSSPAKRLQPQHSQHHATYSLGMAFGCVLLMVMTLLLLLPFTCVDAVGYSYTRFSGPVTGPERKIFVNDGTTEIRGSGPMRFDYVGKPEYEFAYGVEDANAHVLHNRNEMRDGDAVKGVYSLIDPDGTLRVVKYTADETNGFQAEVVRNGISSLHGQLQYDPPSNQYNANYNLQPQMPQAHFRGDRIVVHPSSNTYMSNMMQLHKHATTPPQQTIIYHYNKNYADEDDNEGGDSNGDGDGDVKGNGDGDGDEGYASRGKNESGDQQPHYEVHEKPEGDSQENQDQRPQYKVHEKPESDSQENQDQRPQYKVHEKPDEDCREKNRDQDMGYKSSSRVRTTSYKRKKQHRNKDYDDDDVSVDDDNDDDDEYDDLNDSEEAGDYDGNAHATHNSDESYEYY